MWLIRLAMSRPITIMVVITSILLMSFLAISRMKVDIFPDLNLPVIYVVQPYGGMDAEQIEGFMVSEYEQHFFYISGIEHIESKTIQSASVIKIVFRPDVNMADAMAQVEAQVERSKAYMPPGTVAPFVLRFDAGNVPVGYVVLSSPGRSVAEIQDLAFVRVRPMISTLPGVSSPPPFGGNQRTIVIQVDPERMSAYHLSPDDLVDKLTSGNAIMPSGIVRDGNVQRIVRLNSTVENIKTLENIPVKVEGGTPILLGDLATVEDGTDIPTGYGLVNGKRAVYIAVAKRADASTVSVVDAVKKSIPAIQSQLPEDIKVKFEFDQSIYVTQAMAGVLSEGLLGAVLTGIVVLLFLRDWRSALIVVLNIPLALLSAVVALWVSGQTINIMTLGGLALSVGILVDEATVAIENIHTHLSKGQPLNSAIYHACVEVVTPQLLAMLSVVSVFMPAFFMQGSTQALFIPLSLAVGFAMVASYFLSNTFVPIAAAWLLKHEQQHESHSTPGLLDKLTTQYSFAVRRVLPAAKLIVPLYLVVAVISCVAVYPFLANEIFPTGNATSFQLRLKTSAGTRIEQTEALTKQALDIIKRDAGAQNVETTIAYVGTQPPSYAISNVYMWTSGPQEAVVLVALNPEAHIRMSELKEKLRSSFKKELADTDVTFEAGDIVNQIMNFGSATPIEVDVNGHEFDQDKEYAQRLLAALKAVPELRDLTITQPIDYPTVNIDIDRIRAGQLGVNVKDVGRSVVAATYSSRFVAPVFWRDPHGEAYQIQLQIPQPQMTSLQDIENTPVMTRATSHPVFLRDIAKVGYGNMVGEYDHYNKKRQLSITANLANDDLGRASRRVDEVIKSLGAPPRGVSVKVRGQVPSMKDTFASLFSGVAFAVVCILLMLIGYFQSVRLPMIVISVVPAIFTGVVVTLLVTGTSLNVQSFMGAIMAVGVGVANSILVVVFQEHNRMSGTPTDESAISGASSRLRPVLMTSIAMIAGMIPMALGLGEGGDRQAPLGRAVIGGLTASTASVLFILPLVYALVQSRANRKHASLLPDAVLHSGRVESSNVGYEKVPIAEEQ